MSFSPGETGERRDSAVFETDDDIGRDMERLNAGADGEYLGLDGRPALETDEQYGEAEIPKATDADALHHHIPPRLLPQEVGLNQVPIRLLGSVLHAWPLGRWILNWTVYHHEPGMPISDPAGEMWLL